MLASLVPDPNVILDAIVVSNEKFEVLDALLVNDPSRSAVYVQSVEAGML